MQTSFSGSVKSEAGFILTPVLTAALPLPATVPVGSMRMVSDNGAGNNELCVVINTGTGWITATGQPLS